MSTTASPRFQRATIRGGDLSVADPLPPTLAAIPDVASAVEEHGRIVARLDELRTGLVEARVHLEKVKADDLRKIEDAARAGKPSPKPREGGSAERRLEVAEEELRSFAETVVPNSANGLLAAALPFVEQAREQVAEDTERRLTRAGELLAAVDSELERVQGLADEAFWLERLRIEGANGHAIEPFTPQGGDQRVWQLRGQLQATFAEFLQRRAERAAEQERVARFDAEHEDERERRAEQAAHEQQAQRVVIEDGRITHRGGRPVRQTGFGLQPVEEGEEES